MTKSPSSLGILGALLALSLASAPAEARATRTWVSGKGSDSNACTLAAPCRTFATALTQTAAGGEIDVLDPAGYGSITLTQSISIVNEGVGEAGVQVGAGGTAITINAGTGDTINLRGLTIDGAGVATNGIQHSAGISLTVTNCVVRNFQSNGIYITPSSAMTFLIKDTLVSDNVGSGIYVYAAGYAVKGVIDHVAMNKNSEGFYADGAKASTTILNSVAANNSVGINADYGSVMIRASTVSNGFNGFKVGGSGGTLYIAHSVAAANTYGVWIQGGTVYTHGDNNFAGNGTKVTGGTLNAITSD